MTTIIGSHTAYEIGRVLGVVAHAKVVVCPSVGDASSPVTLLAGSHEKNLGQAADYRHDVELAADAHDAICVMGRWDDDRQAWVVDVTADQAAVAALCRKLGVITEAQDESRQDAARRRMIAHMEEDERTRPAREAAAAQYEAECGARLEAHRPLRDAAIARGRDAETVDRHWRAASRGYEYDRDYHLRQLRSLAGSEA